MSDQSSSVGAPTSETSVVNPTSAASGVNPAQTPAQPQFSPEVNALLAAQAAQYEQRINKLMSEKDKALNERNKAIADLTNLHTEHTQHQEQTQSSLTAAANSAQSAIDRAASLERELAQQKARNAKLAALMQRPHLAPYETLIPEVGDEEKLKETLDQLEQIRQQDLQRYAPPAQAQPQGQPAAQQLSPLAQQASTLQALYGNRANMNPAFMQPQTPIPASSPAQMNPAATTDVVTAINQLFAEARKAGTQEAFDDATRRAAILAQSANPR